MVCKKLAPSVTISGPPTTMQVHLLRDFSGKQEQDWRVIPVEVDTQILWYDPAGFQLAHSAMPRAWEPSWINMFDFTLNINHQVVSSTPYI